MIIIDNYKHHIEIEVCQEDAIYFKDEETGVEIHLRWDQLSDDIKEVLTRWDFSTRNLSEQFRRFSGTLTEIFRSIT